MQYRLDLLKYAAFWFNYLFLRGTSTSCFCVINPHPVSAWNFHILLLRLVGGDSDLTSILPGHLKFPGHFKTLEKLLEVIVGENGRNGL